MKFHKIPHIGMGCKALHTLGIPDGKHDRWCCKFSKPTFKAIGHCRNVNGFEPEEDL